MNQRLVTAIAVEGQNRLHTGTSNAVSKRLRPSAIPQTALIERLTDDESNSGESLRALLRLLIDETVEGLSQSGSENSSVQENAGNLPVIFSEPTV